MYLLEECDKNKTFLKQKIPHASDIYDVLIQSRIYRPTVYMLCVFVTWKYPIDVSQSLMNVCEYAYDCCLRQQIILMAAFVFPLKNVFFV